MKGESHVLNYRRWRGTQETQQRARALRRVLAPAERKLWARWRGQRLCGLAFRRQHPIGSFVVDFCCVAHRLVIEIDGDSHAEQVEYDQERTAWLGDRGFKVIRFTNEQVNHQIEGVLAEIARACGVEV